MPAACRGQPCQQLLTLLAIVGMDQRRKALAYQRVLPISEQLAENGIDLQQLTDATGLQAHDQHPDRRVLEGRAKPLQTLPQRPFRRVASPFGGHLPGSVPPRHDDPVVGHTRHADIEVAHPSASRDGVVQADALARTGLAGLQRARAVTKQRVAALGQPRQIPDREVAFPQVCLVRPQDAEIDQLAALIAGRGEQTKWLDDRVEQRRDLLT